MFITMDPCSLHTSPKDRSRVFVIYSCEWADGKVENMVWSCVILCVFVCMEMRIMGFDAHPFLVSTSNAPGTSCHSLSPSVHFSHLPLPIISLSLTPSCTVLVFHSFWPSVLSFFHYSWFLFSALTPLDARSSTVFPPSWHFYDSIEWYMSFLW